MPRPSRKVLSRKGTWTYQRQELWARCHADSLVLMSRPVYTSIRTIARLFYKLVDVIPNHADANINATER